MVGNHANGEAARHQLVSVSEAYQTVLQEARTVDPVLQSRRSEIMNQIAAVNQRAKAVERMGEQTEAQIEEMYKRAIQELRGIIQEKLNVLHGDEIELKRQQGEIDHLEEYLKYQQQGDATQFLFSWSRHSAYRAELHDFKFFRNSIDVELDVRVSGGINVSTAETGNTGGVGIIGGNANGTGKISKSGSGGGMSQMTSGTVSAGMVGMGMPRKVQERRIQRRTSDFFAESLAMTPSMTWNDVDDQCSIAGTDY
ncbi:hypothetical protein HK100_010581 [Physocladia obscura]|uniref:Uncharacterized protein n=1 Tax=Physocladia obscura TaxID=109957 RepID=A0AAD5T9Q9_9FUNG|nr:hypothetical protein HK100_010581 [Physocladia obscura]